MKTQTKNKHRGWCCLSLKNKFTLTIDDQDIRELYHGKCPYCDKVAKIGKKRPKGRVLSMEEINKCASIAWGNIKK